MRFWYLLHRQEATSMNPDQTAPYFMNGNLEVYNTSDKNLIFPVFNQTGKK